MAAAETSSAADYVDKKSRELLFMQVLSLIKELSLLAERQKGLHFDSGLEERLCAYARSVAHFPTAIKEVSDQFRR